MTGSDSEMVVKTRIFRSNQVVAELE